SLPLVTETQVQGQPWEHLVIILHVQIAVPRAPLAPEQARDINTDEGIPQQEIVKCQIPKSSKEMKIGLVNLPAINSTSKMQRMLSTNIGHRVMEIVEILE